jgi:hypothetical protein
MFRKPRVRLLAVILGLACLLALTWYVGGKGIVETFVQNHTQPWAVFHVPDNPTPLAGLDAKIAANTITLCNRSNDHWNNVLVQIDQGYLAALDHLRSGEFKQMPVHDFARTLREEVSRSSSDVLPMRRAGGPHLAGKYHRRVPRIDLAVFETRVLPRPAISRRRVPQVSWFSRPGPFRGRPSPAAS